MAQNYNAQISAFMEGVRARNPHEPEFLQAVQEVAESVIPFIEENPKYKTAKVLERIAEPERTILFRVSWTGDDGTVHVNRGYRVELTAPLAPTKGACAFTRR
jgi:glutamate dehydrogenase (NADP+)